MSAAAPPVRCPWPGEDPLYLSYHDREWGVVERDDRALFEKLQLDGFQAGLSWIIILRKREQMRRAFDGFDPERLARFDERRIAALLGDPGIVRHRGKIEAAINNARAYLKLVDQAGAGAFSRLLWSLAGERPRVNHWRSTRQVPTETATSQAMSKALKTNGFRFVGPTICYAFMQAVGMVNDHLVSCFRHAPCSQPPRSSP